MMKIVTVGTAGGNNMEVIMLKGIMRQDVKAGDELELTDFDPPMYLHPPSEVVVVQSMPNRPATIVALFVLACAVLFAAAILGAVFWRVFNNLMM